MNSFAQKGFLFLQQSYVKIGNLEIWLFKQDIAADSAVFHASKVVQAQVNELA